jgi:hypothetical protein
MANPKLLGEADLEQLEAPVRGIYAWTQMPTPWDRAVVHE